MSVTPRGLNDALENLLDQKATQWKWEDRARIGFMPGSFN